MAEARRLHRARITVAEGESVLTRVFLDENEVLGVTRIRFDTDPIDCNPRPRMARLTLDLNVDLIFDGKVELLAELHPRQDAG